MLCNVRLVFAKECPDHRPQQLDIDICEYLFGLWMFPAREIGTGLPALAERERAGNIHKPHQKTQKAKTHPQKQVGRELRHRW